MPQAIRHNRNQLPRQRASQHKGDRVRVNVSAPVLNGGVKKDKRNGRNVIVVSSATLPDDIVMNGIRYPAEEIEKSYSTLERTMAPFGHPTAANGDFLSASDPEGINAFHIGAWNENVTRKDGRVFIDKVIDVEVANRTEEGRRVLEAVEAGEPIHTSTALLCELDEGDDEAEYTARNMYFDHDAILLDEDGAGTPDQGVGMLVNKRKDRIDVINSSIEDADRWIDYAGEDLIRAIKRKKDATIWERIKAKILGELEDEVQNEDEDDMTEEQIAKIVKDTMAANTEANAKAIGTAVTEAMKPMTEAMNSLVANAQASEKATREKLVNRLVDAGIIAEDDDGIPTASLERMAARLNKEDAKQKSSPVNKSDDDAGSGDEEDEFKGYSAMNAEVKEGK